MGLLDYFRSRSAPSSASVAKERLQKELIEVIRKYVAVEQKDVSVTLEQEEDREILELNIVLPDVEQERKRA